MGILVGKYWKGPVDLDIHTNVLLTLDKVLETLNLCQLDPAGNRDNRGNGFVRGVDADSDSCIMILRQRDHVQHSERYLYSRFVFTVPTSKTPDSSSPFEDLCHTYGLRFPVSKQPRLLFAV